MLLFGRFNCRGNASQRVMRAVIATVTAMARSERGVLVVGNMIDSVALYSVLQYLGSFSRRGMDDATFAELSCISVVST